MFRATVTHYEAHFNQTAYANIPEYWECQLEAMPKNLQQEYGHITIYGTSQDSRKDAIEDLINQLKKNGWSGRLKVSG